MDDQTQAATPSHTPGARLRAAVAAERPLQVVGATTAYHALMAERTGYEALYLSGGGVAAGSLGLPDLGISTIDDVLIDARRITAVSSLPLLVDIDTGFGGAFNIARSIRSLIQAGAAGCHIEDQVAQKRCGHRPNKQIVSTEEMVDRIKAAVDARAGSSDPHFVIMARTDALASEGLNAALDRAAACVEAGADMVFPEAVAKLEDYTAFVRRVKVPVLANITEFGATPMFTTEELRRAEVSLVLYPLSAFRAANAAALNVYQYIRTDGSQKNVLRTMQTRSQLYDFLGYHAFENKLDELFAKEGDEE
jgi:methylisocitrate lyase